VHVVSVHVSLLAGIKNYTEVHRGGTERHREEEREETRGNIGSSRVLFGGLVF
jgi:hypothetical protein